MIVTDYKIWMAYDCGAEAVFCEIRVCSYCNGLNGTEILCRNQEAVIGPLKLFKYRLFQLA
ncbi:MAG: hypothetical protein DRP56_08475, partial [Planctomycetota bacterium]